MHTRFKGTISVAKTAAADTNANATTKVVFKNYASFEKQKDIDVVTLVYSLFKYSNNH